MTLKLSSGVSPNGRPKNFGRSCIGSIVLDMNLLGYWGAVVKSHCRGELLERVGAKASEGWEIRNRESCREDCLPYSTSLDYVLK